MYLLRLSEDKMLTSEDFDEITSWFLGYYELIQKEPAVLKIDPMQWTVGTTNEPSGFNIRKLESVWKHAKQEDIEADVEKIKQEMEGYDE